MKKCPQCAFESDDSMRFCLNCGAPLPASPIVVNIGGEPNPPGNANPFEKSAETVFKPAPLAAAPPKKKGGKGLMIAGGILALFLLFSVAAAAIAFFAFTSQPKTLVEKDEPPTPAPSRTPNKKTPAPSPSASATPRVSTSETPEQQPALDDPPETDATPESADAPRANFERMWVDYDVREGGKLGMRIHMNFRTFNMKDKDSYVAVFFQNKGGERLSSKGGNYRSRDGQVALYRALKPDFDQAVYNDLQLFMPYNELGLEPGKYDLQMDVDLIDKPGNMIQHLNLHDFQYEQF
jgi:hypothetical protein